MKEKPSYIKTAEVFVSDYFYQLTPKEKKELETFVVRILLQEANDNRNTQQTNH